MDASLQPAKQRLQPANRDDERMEECSVEIDAERRIVRRRINVLTPQQIERRNARRRINVLTPQQIERRNARRRINVLTPEQIARRNARRRINVLTPQLERQNARSRVSGMTPQQIERQNARSRVSGMTLQQIERSNARKRVNCMTPRQIEVRNVGERINVLQNTMSRVNVPIVERNPAQRRMQSPSFKCAVKNTSFFLIPEQHNLGSMDKECSMQHCRAVHFNSEKGLLLHSCCHRGKVNQYGNSEYPPELKILFLSDSNESKNFRNFIRQYNSSNAFASFHANIANIPGNGPYCLKISGEVYHLTSKSFQASAGETPSYAQLYVYDSDEAVMVRMNHPSNAGCKVSIMLTIDEVLRRVSPYANQYKKLREAVQDEKVRIEANGGEMRDIQLLFTRSTADDPRRYNAPTSTNEVAIIYVADHDGMLPDAVDIAVYPRQSREPQKISMLSAHLDPMVFPLLFPTGEFGWTPGLQHNSDFATNQRTKVTSLQFYSNKIAVRRGVFNPMHYAGKLFQQYLIHAYIVCESGRLSYIRHNQHRLRVECYQGLQDHVRNLALERGARVGNIVILPSTFVGGPRHMNKLYQDSMAMVRKFGRPDLFITFTCNPKWPEILIELNSSQTASDRPDLVARIFQLKVEEFMRDIVEKQIFGRVIAWLYVIEEQKRGLPHLHGLFTLCESDKFHTNTDIDNVISAELPESKSDDLYEIVMKNNIHGPCGVLNPKSVCMVNGMCSKKFPKSFRDDTNNNFAGYPEYRRRNNSAENHSVRGSRIDNRYVVPYNPYLTKKYNAHINVEICSSISSVKYLHKYITKGFDCARVEMRQNVNSGEDDRVLAFDEIRQYINCRYVSAPEAAWRIYQNPIYDHSHSVFLLSVHLAGGQSIYFTEGHEEEALRRASVFQTTLTAWFRLNVEDCEARTILYQNIPNNYVFTGDKVWRKRQRGGDKVIGRITSVSPRNVELYHLRLIILKVTGATSFESLRTVRGQLLPSYRDAARELGLIDDNNEWSRCMEEGSTYMMPNALRELFVLILVHCQPSNPLELWNKFNILLSEDFVNRDRQEESSINFGLLSIQEMLLRENSSCQAQGLPQPNFDVGFGHSEIDFDYEVNLGNEMLQKLNSDQRLAFESILESCLGQSRRNNCFFIDGPGGSGKTFLYKALIHVLRGKGKNVLSVAWTGIAALLLPSGVTCHTAFNLPLDFKINSSCRVSSKNRNIIKNADVIIWDEAPMAPVTALDMIESAVRDLMQNDVVFGGKTIVLGGDFRQILPVCKKASRGQLIAMCIKSSHLWSKFKTFHLKYNMRALEGETQFSQWLLDLGEGKIPSVLGALDSSVLIPNVCVSQNVIQSIYNESHTVSDVDLFSKRAILCPKNDHVNLVNEDVLNRLDGQLQTYYSIDKIINDSGDFDEIEQVNYPVEFLNSFNPNGFPPHTLNLKIGAIVMLLRNLSVREGLCNGTRMVIRNLSSNLIHVEIITGEKRGSLHFIPRINLNTMSDPSLPFNMSRKQFPIKLAYAMSINKSQGQTFDKVGILLSEPVFTHGQLYVGCSRVRSQSSLQIQVVDGPRQKNMENCCYTDNIVYTEILH